MKKWLTTLAITITITTTIMIAQEKPISDEELKKNLVVIFGDDHAPPLEYDENGDLIVYPEPSMDDSQNDHGISSERMTRIIEEIIRERLPLLPEAKGYKYVNLALEISGAARSLLTYHGPDTLALLKECVQTKNELICRSAIETYITLQEGEGDSVSFLREATEKKCLYHKYLLRQFLEKIITTLKEKKKDEVVESYHVFLLEWILSEQIASDAEQLDHLLCATLDGYEQSLQHEQMTQKFLDSSNNLIRKRFNEIKTEVEKIPVEKRTDLSKRFNLTKYETTPKQP